MEKDINHKLNIRLFYASMVSLSTYILWSFSWIFLLPQLYYLTLVLAVLNLLFVSYYLMEATKKKESLKNYSNVKWRSLRILIAQVFYIILSVILLKISSS